MDEAKGTNEINEIQAWNSAYGLSKVLLRNLVVGFIMLLVCAVVYLYIGKTKSETDRLQDVKELNNKLEREKSRQDSLNNEFFRKYYELKTNIKTEEAK